MGEGRWPQLRQETEMTLTPENDPRPRTSPGEVLRLEFMAPLGLQPRDLAAHLKVPVSFVEALLQEQEDVTDELAKGLATAFNTSSAFWMNLQQAWRLDQVLSKQRERLTPKISDRTKAVRKAQRIAATYLKGAPSLADDLSRERRMEAKKEEDETQAILIDPEFSPRLLKSIAQAREGKTRDAEEVRERLGLQKKRKTSLDYSKLGTPEFQVGLTKLAEDYPNVVKRHFAQLRSKERVEVQKETVDVERRFLEDLPNTELLQPCKRLQENWRLSGRTMAILMGSSASSWSRWSRAIQDPRNPTWTADQRARALVLLRIYEASGDLNQNDEEAWRWPHEALGGPAFEGRTPLQVMESGYEGLLAVRDYLNFILASWS